MIYGEPTSPRGVRESQFAPPASWQERTTLALASSDNLLIPRHTNAGEVRGTAQVMHNGLLVPTDGYYGSENTELLRANRGVHEPQEERVFAAVLDHVAPGSFMIELGSYWAFYSSWFLSAVKDSRALLVEPDPACLAVGRKTLELNGLSDRAEVMQAWVGRFPEPHPAGAHETTVDALSQRLGHRRIHILHSDVQSQETRMLRGCASTLRRGLIDWFFISTHSMHRHAYCKRFLLGRGFVLVAEADLPESYSYDGLLVFKRRGVPGPERIEVSQRKYPELV